MAEMKSPEEVDRKGKLSKLLRQKKIKKKMCQ